MHTADAHLEVRVPVKAGAARSRRVVRAGDSGNPKACCSRRRPASARTTNEYYHGNPAVEIRHRSAARTARRRRATRRAAARCSSAVPKDAAAEEPCARKILSTLATRAYRRPVTERDIADAARFLQGGPRRSGSFDAGIQRGLERILAAPSFLFRIEREPAGLPRRRRLSPQRSRPGVAAVVLSVEQHSGRRAARRGGARQAERSGRARAAGAAHAARSARRTRWSTTSPAAGSS